MRRHDTGSSLDRRLVVPPHYAGRDMHMMIPALPPRFDDAASYDSRRLGSSSQVSLDTGYTSLPAPPLPTRMCVSRARFMSRNESFIRWI
jgi:hypothetical protein